MFRRQVLFPDEGRPLAPYAGHDDNQFSGSGNDDCLQAVSAGARPAFSAENGFMGSDYSPLRKAVFASRYHRVSRYAPTSVALLNRVISSMVEMKLQTLDRPNARNAGQTPCQSIVFERAAVPLGKLP